MFYVFCNHIFKHLLQMHFTILVENYFLCFCNDPLEVIFCINPFFYFQIQICFIVEKKHF